VKTLLGVILVGVSMASDLLAQGRINFSNSTATPLRISDGLVTEVLGTASIAHFSIGPGAAEIRLFAGLTSSSLAPVLIGTAANQWYVNNTTSHLAMLQGTFSGGAALSLAGFDGSAPVFLQFTAVAYNGVHCFGGYSPIIQVTLATGVAPSTPVFSATPDASHWDGLALIYVPEPKPLGLLLVGAALAAILNSRSWAIPDSALECGINLSTEIPP
jgi:hypothetical protein